MFKKWCIALVCFFCVNSFATDRLKHLEDRLNRLESRVYASPSVVYNYYHGKRSFMRRITKYAVVGGIVYVAYTYVTSDKDSKLRIFIDHLYEAGKNGREILKTYAAPVTQGAKDAYRKWTTPNTSDASSSSTSSSNTQGKDNVSKMQKNEKKSEEN